MMWRSLCSKASRLVGQARNGSLPITHCRYVSTSWSPLESAFNTKKEDRFSINFGSSNVGLFGIPQLTDHTGFYLLQQQAHHEADNLVEEAISPDRTRKIVEIFDELSDCLCRVADMADFVRIAHPDQQYARAAEEACVSISNLVEKLNTNTAIHEALTAVIKNGDPFDTDAIDERVAELFMFDFEQSGIHLSESYRREFVRLNDIILRVGSQFMQGCHTPIFVRKSQLPEHLQYVFALEGDNVMVTGLFSDHHNELVREAAYKIYLYPENSQMNRLDSLLEARDQLAKLVGFSSYSERALRGTMGGSPEMVNNFLTTLGDKLKPRAEEDFAEIRKLKLKFGSSSDVVMPWDVAYYAGLARHDRCQVNNWDLAPYFSLGSCMEGLNYLFEQIYGVTLKHETPNPGEIWCPDIHKIAVQHETEGTLGFIYCDFFERAGKPHQDCHFTIRGGRQQADGTYQLPIVVLMLNMPPPRGKIPSQLTPGMMENLFHEFGHAMHSMLGRTRYQHVTGTRCPTDFAEVPSILMEYFANDYRVLSKFAKHWQTGEPLSYEMMNGLCSAKKMFSASEMQLQVFYSILDQVYHGKHPLEADTMELLSKIQNKYYGLEHVPGTAWHLRFGHFVGYGAKYYAYLMSRAVASRIWHTTFKEDPFSREMGEKYRETMLAHGGGVHPCELVKNMLNEIPDADMMVKALIEDIEDS